MSLRNIIKREHIVTSGDPALPKVSHTPQRPQRGAKLVELEPGRYAIEFVCRCGETSVLEVETDGTQPPQGNQA